MEHYQIQSDYTSEIDLFELISALKKHVWIILSFLITFLFMGYVYTTYLVTPTYTSSASVMVLVEDEESTGEYDYLNAARLLDSVAQLMTMDVILEKVNQELSLGYQNEQLSMIKNNLEIEASDTAFFIEISYESTNKVLAKDIVNEIIDQTIIVTSETEEIPFLVNKIKRVSYAYDGVYTSPNKMLYLLVSGMLGILIGSGLVLVIYFLKNTIKSKKDIIQLLNIEVIGEIPAYDIKGDY